METMPFILDTTDVTRPSVDSTPDTTRQKTTTGVEETKIVADNSSTIPPSDTPSSTDDIVDTTYEIQNNSFSTKTSTTRTPLHTGNPNV
ncbi:unnamed protein product [Rodentolepis nana]|uniref:Uncharacterized protein n=1 Tax=Rodentolepis nana TaxID=102285 RepID=A0A0R3TJ08_RODNA|nr:unnamed protein product [Rodentolepis nana]